MFLRSFVALSLSLSCAWAANTESFIVTCSDVKHPAHLVPLSFVEFEDEAIIKDLSSQINAKVTGIAPLTFKELPGKFASARFVAGTFKAPTAEQVEPLTRVPTGCTLQIAASQRSGTEFSVNSSIWHLLSPELQKYLILEAVVGNYLKHDLAPVDYRRFAVYTATQVFSRFSIEEKIFFLKHYGIGEMAYSNISLDLSREYKLSEKSGKFLSAYAFPGATFEKARLDTIKYISFYESGAVEALSTLTPFKRIINGQEFSLISFNTFSLSNPRDRTFFYPDGSVECSDVLPFKNFYDVITNIKSGWFPSHDDVISVCFHKDQSKRYFNTGRRGSMKVLNKTVNAFAVEWYDNGQLESVSFEPTHLIIDGQEKELRTLRFDRNGKIKTAY